mgnify:CR=1 FL=1
MDKEQILTEVLNKFSGNIDEDFKLVLGIAEQYRKASRFDIMKDVIYLLEKRYGEAGKQKLVEAAKENIKRRFQCWIKWD